MQQPTSTRKYSHTCRAENCIRSNGSDPTFPAWDTPDLPQPRMSLDQYLAFVDFCWERIPDKDRVRRQRDDQIPTVRFEL